MGTKLTPTQKYVREMKKLVAKIDKAFLYGMVDLTNNFIRDNPDYRYQDVANIDGFERDIDDIALHASWIIDRLNHKTATISSADYRGSVTKKIRKALGYTY